MTEPIRSSRLSLALTSEVVETLLKTDMLSMLSKTTLGTARALSDVGETISSQIRTPHSLRSRDTADVSRFKTKPRPVVEGKPNPFQTQPILYASIALAS